MEGTGEFVDKIHKKQRNDSKNKRTQGAGTPGNVLPGKQHSTNK